MPVEEIRRLRPVHQFLKLKDDGTGTLELDEAGNVQAVTEDFDDNDLVDGKFIPLREANNAIQRDTDNGDLFVEEVNDVVATQSAYVDGIKSTADSALQTHQDISGKENTISDLAAIRSGAALGTSSLQTHQDISGKENTISDLAAIRSGAALGTSSLQTHQDLTGYLGDWDSTRQYDANDLADLDGIIYRNNEIFIDEGYSAGSTEMLIQTDNGTVTFIASIRFEGNTVSSAISINDDRVTNLGGGNYSVRIGHRLWTSTGVSQNTDSLSATRDEDSFTLRLDETATIGESPTTNPEYWERITTTATEIAAIGTNTDNITANATAIGNITEGFEEYNATKDTANEYAVNDIVWYKHTADFGEEINLFWKFTTNIAAGVPTVDEGSWELMSLDNAERAAIATNTAAIGTNTAAITANATSITNIDIGNGTITIEQNGNSVGAFTTNQSGDDTIKLLDTTTTVINTTVVNNATEYVKDTLYALATQIKFTDTDGNVHYYEKYGEPEFYSGVWASIDPYLPTRIVSHSGFYYVASGNGATPGQEPNTGATDGDGEQAWVLIDINPVDYSNTWKPLVPNHFEISANNGAATTATLNTLDIDGTNYVIPVGGGTTLPDQADNAGKYLVTNGTVLAWQPLGTVTPNPKLSTFDLFFGTRGLDGTDGGDGTEAFEFYTHGVLGAYYWFLNRGTGGEWANARLNADQTIKFDLAGNDT